MKKTTAIQATSFAAAIMMSVVIPALSASAAPTNDNFVNRQSLFGAAGTVSTSNVGGTAEVGEPAHAGTAATTSVWFSHTPAATVSLTVDTCGSDYDTILAIYTGTALAALTPVAANDDGCGTQSKVTFTATAGIAYSIVVDGFDGDTGNLVLAWSPPVATPTNDLFANASVLTGLSGMVSGTTAGATVQANEPAHGGLPTGHSVWFKYVPGSSGPFTIDSCTSSFDSVVAIYTGATLATLVPVAANDDACGIQSVITTPVTAATTYWIALAGVGPDAGAFTMHWTLTATGTTGPPTITETQAGDGWVSVAWDAPVLPGGSAITTYAVTTTPGNTTTTVAAPGTRAVVSGLTNTTTYTFTVKTSNTAGLSAPSISVADMPVAGAVDITTNYDTTEIGRLQQTATYFGSSIEQAQHDCVGVIAFILGLIPPAATPISPVPTNTGPVSVTSTYPSPEQQFITSVSKKYAFTPAEAQKFSTQLVGFLLALGGH